MAQPDNIDILVRTELGRTSSFEPQRFYDIIHNADPELLREVLPTAVPSTQFFLCKQVIGLPDSARKVEIALVLSDELHDEQTAGVEQVTRSFSHHYREVFIRRALESGNLHSWTAALGLAVRDKAKHLIPDIIPLWEPADNDHRIAISDALFALGGHRTNRFLQRQLLRETDSEVILPMLTSSLKLKRYRAFRRSYQKFSNYSDPAIRFCGLQGLAERASWWTFKRFLHELPKETDLRNFNLIGRVLVTKPNIKLAQLLFGLATVPQASEFRDAAARLFRSLPISILQPFCLTKALNKDPFIAAYALREAALSNDLVVQETLIEVATDGTQPLIVRNAAIEGLTYHKADNVIDLLFSLQYEKEVPELLRYSALTALTKLCDETHVDRILPMLMLDETIHAYAIQAMLTFIRRKVRAKKIVLNAKALDHLCKIVFESRNNNCRYLALNTLLICRPNVSLQPFLKLATDRLGQHLTELLSAFLATRIQAEVDMFLYWLVDDERTTADILTGLAAIQKTQGNPESDPMLFVNLLSWQKGHNDPDLRPEIVRCLHHLLRSPETSQCIAEQLPQSDDVFYGLLDYMNDLPLKDLQAFAHDRLINWLSANSTAAAAADLIPLVAQFKTEAARACLIKLFRWSDTMREHICESVHNAIVKV
ncbi:hypothetical protein BVY04_02015 [bacterium M21]|nr:hypothetical protein BVY04_02015 [bacterium M21]